MADAGEVGGPRSVWSATDREAAETFALLSDGTRLTVLLALWEAYDPWAADNTVPFSQILDRVGINDPGNLSYHLEKLNGRFIRQPTERGGYELSPNGQRFVRGVIAGTGIQEESLGPTAIDDPCPFCNSPTAVTYEDGFVIHTCTECEGGGPAQTDTQGFLSAVHLDPAGLNDRDPGEVYAASQVAALREVQSLFDGLCPACSGRVDGWLECCTNHDKAGNCETCGMKLAAWARFECRVCKNHSTASPKALAIFHPAVVSLYDDHGVSTRIRAEDLESVRRVEDLVDTHEMETVSADPPKAAVHASRADDEVVLTFDERVGVTAVRNRP